jgi:Uma2 family endonuclease
MPGQKNRRWTAREVRQLIEDAPLATPRYELVDGELLVTPGPGWAHQAAVKHMLIALHEYLERQGIGEVLDSPSDVELEPEDVRQPDIYVMPADEWRRVRREGMPVRALSLAVEIVSPSSSRIDRVKKRSGYQRHVDEYWVMDTDARIVERWRAARIGRRS